jgi:amidase
MAKTVEDLELYCSSVIEGQPWLHDPRCIEIPWREPKVSTKLKIGVMWNDGVVIPTPPVTRALGTVVAALKAKGHEVIDWEPTFHREGIELVVRMPFTFHLCVFGTLTRDRHVYF